MCVWQFLNFSTCNRNFNSAEDVYVTYSKEKIQLSELVISWKKNLPTVKKLNLISCTRYRFPFTKLSTSYLPKFESDWNWTTWRSVPALMQYRCFLKIYGVLNYAKPLLTSWILFFTSRKIDSHVKPFEVYWSVTY